jgi:chlorophyll synthase
VSPGAVRGLVRPFTLLAPVVGTLCGATVARAATGVGPSVLALVAAATSAALATGASNAWNQAFDAELDRVNKPSRPVPSGRTTPRAALLLGHALAAAALLSAVAASTGFLACLAVGLLSTWVYSAPPLRTKRHPLLSNLTIAFARGLLVPVAGWAAAGADPLHPEPWALGVVPFLFVLGAATTKDFADVEGDRAHGCRTLPVLLGPVRAARIVAPFLVAPFALYPLLGAIGLLSPPLVRFALLACVLAAGGVATARSLLSDPGRLLASENHPAWRGMYLLMLGAHVGVAVVYAV